MNGLEFKAAKKLNWNLCDFIFAINYYKKYNCI